MEKQTPIEALEFLRKEVENEIIKSRSTEKKVTNAFTGVLMSKKTYETLKKADEYQNYFIGDGCYSSYDDEYNLDFSIKSSLCCYCYCGYIMINDSLAYGKVVIKRYYPKER